MFALGYLELKRHYENSSIEDPSVPAQVSEAAQQKTLAILKEVFGIVSGRCKRTLLFQSMNRLISGFPRGGDRYIAQMQLALLQSAKCTVETRIFTATASIFFALIWRGLFYTLVIGQIGSQMGHAMSIDELNDAIGEIPFFSMIGSSVFGGFVGAGRLMMQFVNVFRDLDERYAEAAQNIAFAQTYIDAYSSALLGVDLPFSSAVVHRFRTGRRMCAPPHPRGASYNTRLGRPWISRSSKGITGVRLRRRALVNGAA